MLQVEIRVKGCLDKSWSESLGELDIGHTTSGETLLTGQVRDQAMLRGLLTRLADIGAELISVNTEQLVDK